MISTFTIVQLRYLYPYKDGHIVCWLIYDDYTHLCLQKHNYSLIERQIHSWPRLVGYIKLYLTISMLHDHSITIASPYLLVHIQGWSTPSYQETQMTLLFQPCFKPSYPVLPITTDTLHGHPQKDWTNRSKETPREVGWRSAENTSNILKHPQTSITLLYRCLGSSLRSSLAGPPMVNFWGIWIITPWHPLLWSLPPVTSG